MHVQEWNYIFTYAANQQPCLMVEKIRSCQWVFHHLKSHSGCKLASFPGLPRFYLPSVFTIIHGSRRSVKNREGLGAFITWVDARWSRGEGPLFKYIRTKLESEFLAGFYHAKVWSPKGLRSENSVEHSNGWSCMLFWQLDPSPHFHLASTWCHSRDCCSQAFPVLIFCQSSNSMYYCEHKGKIKVGET